MWAKGSKLNTKKLVCPRISNRDNNNLISTPSQEGIKDVVFQQGPLKLPCLEGYPPSYCQHMWDSVGGR